MREKRGMMWKYVFLVLLCVWQSVEMKIGKGLSSLTYKRVISEWKEVKAQNISLEIPFENSAQECGIRLSPMKSNILEWHFSFSGMKGSDYENGIYHGVIMLHPDYPRQAPRVTVITPSGRWAVGKDICLSGILMALYPTCIY